MDKETREQLIDECIAALQQAKNVLNKNIGEIQNASSDLQDKQQLLEQWNSESLRLNQNLLIDFDNIVSPNLNPLIQESIERLRELKSDLFQYINMIEREFETLAPGKLDKLEGLLKPKGE